MKNDRLKIFRPRQVDGLVRLGSAFDGGYIVHAPSLQDAEVLVNYGIGYDTGFEEDFFKRTGKATLAFDPTLKSFGPVFQKFVSGQFIPFLRHLKNRLLWIFKETQLRKYQINYIQEGIAAEDKGKFKSLRHHYDQYGLANKKILLKIDVEGAEYEVFSDPAVYALLSNCLQIILEFHGIERNFDQLLTIMEKLSETHGLIHIHHNNHTGTFLYEGKNVPEAIEVTFLRNDYLAEKNYTNAAYPLEGLDQPCHKHKKDLPLDFFY